METRLSPSRLNASESTKCHLSPPKTVTNGLKVMRRQRMPNVISDLAMKEGQPKGKSCGNNS